MGLRPFLFWKYAILAVVSALYLYPFVRSFSGSADYGVFLNGADLLNHGAIPSRDFVEPQGPGSFVWLALFFRLFGTTLATARAVLTATGVGTGLLAFYLSRTLGATGLFGALFVVVISVPLLPINSPHYDSNLFALAALAVFLAAWNEAAKGEPPASWKLVLAAVLCGLTTWMIQQKGYCLAVALLISLLWLMRRKAFRPAMIFAGCFAVVALSPFVFFTAVHALPDVLFANYLWPLRSYSELNQSPYGFPAWRDFRWSIERHANHPIGWIGDFAFTFAIPFLLVALLPLLLPLAARLSGPRWFTAPILPYWLAAYALWIAELQRIDIGHLRNGVVIMVVLFFSICEVGTNKYLRRAGFGFAISLVFAGAINFRMSLENDRKQETRRGAIYVEEDEPLLGFLDTHTHAGDEVFVYPYQPIYYFFEQLKNPTRYSYLLYHLQSNAQFAEAVGDLDRKKVRYVIFDSVLSGQRISEIFPAYRQPGKAKLIMEPYLDARYRLAFDLGRFHVLERRDDAH